jgi:hypothetical protein
VAQRAAAAKADPLDDSEPGPFPALEPSDLRFYLRFVTHAARADRPLQRFLKKLQARVSDPPADVCLCVCVVLTSVDSGCRTRRASSCSSAAWS